MSLRSDISTPAGKQPYVRRLFTTIADRYDLITVLLSCGQDSRWKRRLVGMAGPLQCRRVLDLACGTGDIALAHSATEWVAEEEIVRATTVLERLAVDWCGTS